MGGRERRERRAERMMKEEGESSVVDRYSLLTTSAWLPNLVRAYYDLDDGMSTCRAGAAWWYWEVGRVWGALRSTGIGCWRGPMGRWNCWISGCCRTRWSICAMRLMARWRRR